MYPGAHAENRPDQPAVIMAGTRRGHHLPRSSTTRPTACSQLFRVRRARARRPRRLLPREPPALPRRSPGAATTPASTTPPCRSRLTDRGDGVHHRRLRGAGVHHVGLQGGRGRPSCSTRRPDVETRLMIDGTIDGYDPYEEAIAAQPAEPLDEDRIAGTRHALQLGHHRPAQGREAADAERSRSRRRAPSVYGLLGAAVRARPSDTVYLSPAPLYHAAPLRFCMAVHQVGGTVVVMEHFDPEQCLALDRAAPGHPQPGGADDVHPHAQAPRRGAGPLRRLVACRSPSTPRRRARSRSRSR